MEVLRQELDKALLYCLDSERVDAPDLEHLVGKSREDAVWEITDAVRARDSARALTLCEDMLAAGTFPLVLLTLLVRQARHLLQARLLWERAGRPRFRDFRSFQSRLAGAWEAGCFGKGADDVTAIHPFASFKRFDAARHYSLEQLRTMVSRLRRAEREMKTGAVAGPREALEELLLDLCLEGREAA
jgi:DNA polymerase-3 subunit delta